MSTPPTTPTSTGFLHIRDLKHGQKNIHLEFMILEHNGMNRTKDGDQVWVFKVADSTACINFAIIGDAGRHLKPGDICKVLNGFCSMFKGALTFYVGKSGTFRRTGEFCFLTTEELNMSVQKAPQSVTQSPGVVPVRPNEVLIRLIALELLPNQSVNRNRLIH